MKIAVIGSRSVNDNDLIYELIEEFIEKNVQPDESITIMSGGAKGIDSVAQEFAKINNYDFVLFEPYHKVDTRAKFNARYFFVRNQQLILNADAVLAIWDGESKGTAHGIELARVNKKLLHIEVVNESEESKATA
jgi:predicted Rossmann-fold nucleotide-binding protein